MEKSRIENKIGDKKIQKNQIIPYNIFQTFKYRDVPISMYNNVIKWNNLNPEYNYYFYDDKEMVEYLNNYDFKDFDYDKNTFFKAFNKIKPGAGKADLFRLVIIYDKGGCYFDIDTTCIKPLSSFIKSDDEVVSGLGSQKDFHQWGLIYKKKHHFIKKALEIAIYNIIKEKFIKNICKLEFLCGPSCLDLAIKKVLNLNDEYKFKSGKHLINGISFRILNGDYFNNNISFKYKEYKNDLKKLSMKHWGYEDIFNK